MSSSTRSARLSAILSGPSGNLSSSERWVSLLAGLGLTAVALSRGGLLRRLALAAGGAALVSRGTTGFCGMKSALSGDSTLKAGLAEQWQRTRSRLGASAGSIHSLHDLYIEELQELAGGALELHALTNDIRRSVEHAELAIKLHAYGSELRSRAAELQRMLAGSATLSVHPDQAFAAMLTETRKMKHVPAGNVRDAALIDSFQRLLHYQLAAYGSVASYARALNRPGEATHLADYATRDKTMDAELTELATGLVNVHAAAAPQDSAPGEARPH
jgi:ferritin-like metal-binding protein YciE